MKTIKTLLLALIVAHAANAQPAEGAYFSNTELLLHPRKITAPNGQIAYMWSDCYEQLNFIQRADLKQYYDSALAVTNKKIEEAQQNNLLHPDKVIDTRYWDADLSFYTRKLQYIKEYDDWEAKQ